MRYVRQSFSDNFANVAWMDDETKERAVEKANAISQMIGYPDFIVNVTKLDEHYANVRNDATLIIMRTLITYGYML